MQVLRNASGIPFGMVTPRMALDEMIKRERKREGQSFLVKRLGKIRKHLAKCYLPRCPVSLLDLPMKEVEFDAVIKEAWATVQSEPDGIKTLIQNLAAQGRA